MSGIADVSVDAFYPHPPAKVWRALTEPELIGRWLMPGEFRLEVGHRYAMRSRPMPAAGFSGAIEAEVLAFEPERMLRVAWRDPAGGGAWVITWTLRPEGRGTRLLLLQQGGPGNAPAAAVMAAGWRGPIAARLTEVLDAL